MEILARLWFAQVLDAKAFASDLHCIMFYCLACLLRGSRLSGKKFNSQVEAQEFFKESVKAFSSRDVDPEAERRLEESALNGTMAHRHGG